MAFSTRYGLALVLGTLSLSTPAQAGSIQLPDSRHDDHRQTPKLEFPEASGASVKSAEEYLRTHGARYEIPSDLSNLELVGVRQSLIGTHSRYRQVLNGRPVEGAEIVVSRRRSDGSVYQVYNNTYPVTASVPPAKTRLSAEAALQQAWNHLRVHGALTALPKADLIYVPEKSGFRLVYQTLICVTAPYGFWEHKIDAATGDVLSVRRHEISEKYAQAEVPDFSAYRGPTTSLQTERSRIEAERAAAALVPAAAPKATVNGTALVFDPDPRTTLNNAALVDGSAAASFNAAYVSKALLGITSNAGVCTLTGPWVAITNMASELPATAVSTSTSGSWTNKRGNNGFNDVMCYYHIDQNQRYLQSLGYVGDASIQAVPIPVDSDGVDGDDNSHYVPSQNSLAFGHGGVDDDEDADVILHEYGHALTYDTTPTFGGGDSGAIGEGFGDYWGASYSWTCTNGNVFNPAWAFSWDGHSADTWAGRFLDKTNLTYDHATTYDAHQTIGGVTNYSDQLWGTPIYMAFRDLIALGRPREEMDTIVIESFFGVGSGVKMRDLASATVMAAMALYPTGQHAAVYYTRFTNQSILIAFPLPDPTLTYPAGGESFTTGSVINVQWDRNGALSKASGYLEYNSQLSGGAPYFYDSVESGTNGWVPTKTGSGSSWYIAATSNHSPTRSWFAADNVVTGDQFLARASIVVSNGAVLSFWHSYDLEEGYDGAVVEISTNGTTWRDLGTNATQNGYVAAISSDYGSSIGGRSAFTGSSGGFIETKIPLASYAGKTVSIRFRESDDDGTAATGWWVDDIKISIDAPWTYVATTATNASSYAWTLPGTVGTNYGVRVKLVGSNCMDSGWATSPAFTLAAGVPNAAPTNVVLSGTNVAENLAAGAVVGSFATQDPDAGNTFTYSLVAGTGSTDNGSFSIGGSNLLTTASFNYEVQSNFSIRVQSADQGGLSTQKIFAIHVADVDELPPEFSGLSPLSGTNVVLTWGSISGHTYTLYYSTNLLSGFDVLQSNMPAAPNFNSFTDSVTAITQKYWMIKTDP